MSDNGNKDGAADRFADAIGHWLYGVSPRRTVDGGSEINDFYLMGGDRL